MCKITLKPVPCPAGYHTSATDPSGCERCGLDTYQSAAGQATCTDCPVGTGTFAEGADSAGHCYREYGLAMCCISRSLLWLIWYIL